MGGVMKLTAIVLFTLFTGLSAHAHGGIDAGGGYVVYCMSDPDFHEGGYYALEYAMAIGKGMHATDFVPIQDWDGSSARVAALLTAAVPELAPSFADFVKSTSAIFNVRPPISG